jgi:hypothetical protein
MTVSNPFTTFSRNRFVAVGSHMKTSALNSFGLFCSCLLMTGFMATGVASADEMTGETGNTTTPSSTPSSAQGTDVAQSLVNGDII